MKLLDKYLTPEFISTYLKEKDPAKVPTHVLDFSEYIVNVLTHQENMRKDKKAERNILPKVEEEIKEISSKITEKLYEEQNLKSIIKDFTLTADSFNFMK